MQNINDFIGFLSASPTAYHAADNVKGHLLKTGFKELDEKKKWTLVQSGKYFLQDGGTIAAFTLPKASVESLLLLASHTDSPALKLKPQAEFKKEGMVMLAAEVYGGPLLSSWLNRDLGIAGKIVRLGKNGKTEEHLVNQTTPAAVIPQLAIHLDRKVNDEGLLLNKQEHLNALATLKNGKTPYLEKLFGKNILSHDLFLYPVEAPNVIGGELLAAYRLDSLASVYSIMTAFLNDKTASLHELKMAAFFDHEEIGSNTQTGAGSPFFSHLLERITLALKQDREAHLRLIKNSLCVSVDLGHAVNPNYIDRHDHLHKPTLGSGIQLKTSAAKKYATDTKSSKRVLLAARKAKVTIHPMTARNDIPCGSTIGPIQAALTGIPTVDLGIGQLSMHSTRELIALEDLHSLIKLLSQLLHT